MLYNLLITTQVPPARVHTCAYVLMQQLRILMYLAVYRCKMKMLRMWACGKRQMCKALLPTCRQSTRDIYICIKYRYKLPFNKYCHIRETLVSRIDWNINEVSVISVHLTQTWQDWIHVLSPVIVAVDQLSEEWLPFYGVQRSRK
jgi:hypothetical protein